MRPTRWAAAVLTALALAACGGLPKLPFTGDDKDKPPPQMTVTPPPRDTAAVDTMQVTPVAPPTQTASQGGSGLNSVIQIAQGYIAGSGGAVRSYKGIPYAAPPVGPLRWKPPQPAPGWEGVKVANTFGPGCMQGRTANPLYSEDCLTLNVWTPAKAANARLPVLVWIHGGSFETGTGTAPVYDGSGLAGEGVVVVTLNYRLGIFGFFAHPELSSESPEGVSGNQGVLDMIAALNWVKANVAAFGGDANNVTIMGESAGGTGVGLLLLTPKARGLYQRAVASSPWGFFQPISHLKQSWYGRPSAESEGAARGKLASLRAMAADKVLVLPRETGSTRHQIVDGVVFPDDPTVMLQKGQLNRADLIVGTNRDEGTIFAREVKDLAEAQANANAAVTPGADAMLPMYGGNSDATANAALRMVVGDTLFGMGARELARSAAQKSNVFMYEFTRVSGAGARTGLGAFHGSDIPYWFRNLPLVPFIGARLGPLRPDDFTEVDDRLSLVMSVHLLNFVKHGDPNGRGLAAWPKFGDGGERYVEFASDGESVKANLRKPQLDALQKLHLDLLAKRGGG